jgi:hypothetical protein
LLYSEQENDGRKKGVRCIFSKYYAGEEMKKIILTISLMLVMCSCRQVNSNSESSDNIMARYDEIYKIYTDHIKRQMKREIENDPNVKIIEENRSEYVFRGPITKEQVEKELLEFKKKFPGAGEDLPFVPDGLPFDNYKEVLNEYQDGDEFYHCIRYGTMSMIEEYLLIRENELLGEIVTNLGM